MKPNFRQGMLMPSYDSTPFDYPDLPDEEKKALCVDLLNEFGASTINERGDELHHQCVMPWHNDRAPSAQMNWAKLVYKCFSCDSSGGLLWLISTCRDEDTAEARNWLRSQTKFEAGSEDALDRLLDFFDAVYDTGRQEVPIPKMSLKALDPWKVIHPYLTEIRGINRENIISSSVGYGTFRIRNKLGEMVQSERIVVPHFWHGDLVGWQTRRLTDDGTAKWHNSPDFPKDTTVYNFEPDRHDTVVVVEAPLSVVAKGHLAHMVSTFGAGVGERQIQHLSKYRKIVLWMDNDAAGYKAILGRDKESGWKTEHTPGLGELLEPYSQVWVVDSPYDADPADMSDDLALSLIQDAAVPFPVWQPPLSLKPLEA